MTKGREAYQMMIEAVTKQETVVGSSDIKRFLDMYVRCCSWRRPRARFPEAMLTYSPVRRTRHPQYWQSFCAFTGAEYRFQERLCGGTPPFQLLRRHG